jgi:hypothetical protein
MYMFVGLDWVGLAWEIRLVSKCVGWIGVGFAYSQPYVYI